MNRKMKEFSFDMSKQVNLDAAEEPALLQLILMATNLVDHAKDSGLILRLAGGLACWCHSPEAADLLSMRVAPYSDIDFAARMTDKDALTRLFASHGFHEDLRTATVPGLRRSLLKSPETDQLVDVSYDVLEYNHRIVLRDRITVDYPTLSPSDLLLQKLQIVEFTQKDCCDAMMLVIAHEVSEQEGNCLNIKYLAELCSSDWGLWRTATGNLHALGLRLDEWPLAEARKRAAQKRLEALSYGLHTCQKSIGWKLRSLLGDRVPWYTAVDCL